MKKKVFIYVGHSNWGKSMTLKLLTEGNSKIKFASISGYTFKVRKMSNDDDGQGLLNWVKDIPNIPYDKIIIAFCPKLADIEHPTEEEETAMDIIFKLQETNELFFFIQMEKYNAPNE